MTAGVVRFQPANGPMAAGGLDASGRFKLTTKQPNDGAREGSYKIVIVPFYPSAADMPAGAGQPDPKNIPKKYRDLDTTPLTRDVIGGQLNEFNFELAD